MAKASLFICELIDKYVKEYHYCLGDSWLRIIDAHVHYPSESGLQAFAEACEKTGIEKCFMCALPDPRLGNAVVEKTLKEYLDLVRGFAYIDLDKDEKGRVEQVYSVGFTGIKLISPGKPYDWEGYFPLYEEIDRCEMPVLLHTGIVTRGTKASERGVTSSNMRPVYLETIARSFPKLTLIGAHLGHPWCEEAAVVSFHNPNVFFDISGGHTFYIALTIWRRFGYDLKPSKILFGTDSPIESLQKFVNYWEVILPQLGLKDEELKLIFHDNAARIVPH